MSKQRSIRRGVACACLFAGFALTGIGAQTPPQNGALSGRVLDGDTGRPVVGADVVLDVSTGGSSRGGAPRTNRGAVTSDALGRFLFTDVPPGTHRIEASKAGYRTGYPGGMTPNQGGQYDPFQLAAGDKQSGIVVRVWRSAVISGHVRTKAGTPLAKMSVGAMRIGVACNAEHLYGVPGQTTDDTGAYRFFDLAQGDYAIMLNPIRGDTIASTTYPTSYHPGVVDPDSAQTIHVEGGDERNDIDVIVPDGGVTVTGRLTASDGSPFTGKHRVDLWVASARIVDRPVYRAFTEPDGRFEFRAVPPGHYSVRTVEYPKAAAGGVTQSGTGFMIQSSSTQLPPISDADTLWGVSTIDVIDRDVSTTVRMDTGWRIQGTVKFDAPAESLPDSSAMLPVLTHRSDGSDPGGSFQSGRVEGDGQFKTTAFPVGRYTLSVMLGLPSATRKPSELSIEKIALGSRDVTGLPLEVNGSDVRDVTLTFTNRGPKVSGTIDGGAELETFGAAVYLFPTDERYWLDCALSPRITRKYVGADGRFQTAAVPPGEYFVAAAIGAQDYWIKTDFFRSLVPVAVRVKLALGDSPSVQLKARARK